jgi:hypothetical protein
MEQRLDFMIWKNPSWLLYMANLLGLAAVLVLDYIYEQVKPVDMNRVSEAGSQVGANPCVDRVA